jgi:glycosyltransferase involved in cell wall biosynthesis
MQRKGYADLIQAFALIRKQAAGWKLVFAGDGEVEEGKKTACDLGISDRVTFAGWVSGEDKEVLFATAAIFCQPSYTEGFPMAILEAFTYGIPVIATPVGGIPDILYDGVNALLCAPGDVQALAHCLQQLITQPDLRERFGKESLHLAETVFSRQVIEKQLCTLYEELLN